VSRYPSKPWRLAAAFAVSLALAGAASAQPAGNVSVRKACATDIKTYCHGVSIFGGAMGRCIKTHWDQLSDGCQAAIKEMRARRHESDTGGASEP
jgi:hypothetical protein